MMAKTKHRILATLLAAALIVGMLPASALAAEGAGSVIELTVGESYAIPNAAGSALEDLWWSDNESIAAVEDGVVTGVSAGETTVHHTYYEAVYEKVEVPAAPVETTPAETVTPIPEETTPVEELPEETAPVEELPEETAPVEELPEETAPVEELPEETAPVEELPEETAPVEELPEETAPVEELPEETAPVEETPEESAPAGDEAGPDSAADSTGELAASAVGAALLRGIGSVAGSLTLSHGVSTADGSSALPVSPDGEGEPAPEEGPAPGGDIRYLCGADGVLDRGGHQCRGHLRTGELPGRHRLCGRARRRVPRGHRAEDPPRGAGGRPSEPVQHPCRYGARRGLRRRGGDRRGRGHGG